MKSLWENVKWLNVEFYIRWNDFNGLLSHNYSPNFKTSHLLVNFRRWDSILHDEQYLSTCRLTNLFLLWTHWSIFEKIRCHPSIIYNQEKLCSRLTCNLRNKTGSVLGELCFAARQNCFWAAYRFMGQILNRQSENIRNNERHVNFFLVVGGRNEFVTKYIIKIIQAKNICTKKLLHGIRNTGLEFKEERRGS